MDKEADLTILTVERLIEALQQPDVDPQELIGIGEKDEAPGELSLLTLAHQNGEVTGVREIWKFRKGGLEQ